jgi:ABC-2 type transport system permease protein
MRFSQAWTIARHDMRLFRQRRGILAGLVAFPIGVGIGFPILVGLVIIPRGGPDATSFLPNLINAFSFWFVIGAASLPTTVASYSIVGEKVSKSLEPLLATPSTDGEIIVGKALAAFIPTILGTLAGSAIFQTFMDIETRGALGYLYYPNWTMTVILLVLMPLVAVLAIEASVVISSRVTDVRSAQQYAGLIFLPLIFLYIASEVSLTLDVTNLLYIGGAFAIVVAVLSYAALRAFRRDEILTRWR